MFREYSFVFAGLAVFAAAAILLLSRKPRWQEFLSLGVIGVGLIAAWGVLHPVQTPLMESAQKVQNMIGQGTPVLLEFQSPF